MMYPDVVHVAMGDLLRERVQGTPEQKWLDIMDVMRDGKMAPEVCVVILHWYRNPNPTKKVPTV